MSMPCSRILENFQGAFEGLVLPLAPLGEPPPSSEPPHAPSANVAATAAMMSGDLVMAGHEARPT
jgi:hypothetical protein